MLNEIIKKYDWWLYLKFYKSLERRNVDKAYLMMLQLKLQDMKLELQMSNKLKDATEKFYQALKNFAVKA